MATASITAVTIGMAAVVPLHCNDFPAATTLLPFFTILSLLPAKPTLLK
jgi:hypothetical protein